MGVCFSSDSGVDLDQKKRSQMIDKGLEEDSKRLRKECKILLLGPSCPSSETNRLKDDNERVLTNAYRLWRERKVDDRETDEDHPPEWILSRRAVPLPVNRL